MIPWWRRIRKPLRPGLGTFANYRACPLVADIVAKVFLGCRSKTRDRAPRALAPSREDPLSAAWSNSPAAGLAFPVIAPPPQRRFDVAPLSPPGTAAQKDHQHFANPSRFCRDMASPTDLPV